MKLSQSAPRLHRILASTMILILLISRHADSMPPPRLRLSGARGVSRSDEVAAPSRLRPPVTLPMTQRGQEGSRNNGGFISTLSTGPSQGTQVAMKSTPRVLDSADVDGDICVICRDLLDEKGTLALIFPQIPGQDQNYFRTLSGCGHRFHRACVDAWGRKNPTCPICRNADSELEKLREKRWRVVSLYQPISTSSMQHHKFPTHMLDCFLYRLLLSCFNPHHKEVSCAINWRVRLFTHGEGKYIISPASLSSEFKASAHVSIDSPQDEKRGVRRLILDGRLCFDRSELNAAQQFLPQDLHPSITVSTSVFDQTYLPNVV
ncbi:hypothetical protein KEM48_014376 [Puccinia striiformis f. sp. tritici PST-130]|nr:hypothetical protein KEM48_014376 [Puccinia striiformis f. sp. tritici PST-130]